MLKTDNESRTIKLVENMTPSTHLHRSIYRKSIMKTLYEVASIICVYMYYSYIMSEAEVRLGGVENLKLSIAKVIRLQ